jgi:hypothetical protein
MPVFLVSRKNRRHCLCLSGNPLYGNSLRPPGLSTGALEFFQWNGGESEKKWLAWAYLPTDRFRLCNRNLQLSTDTHVHTSQS